VFVTFVPTRCQDLGDLGGRRTANRLVIDQAHLFVSHKAHNVISARVISVQLLSVTAGNIPRPSRSTLKPNLHVKPPLTTYHLALHFFRSCKMLVLNAYQHVLSEFANYL
jgi:hypothetical protein